MFRIHIKRTHNHNIMSYPATEETAKNYTHKFWSKQPTMMPNEIVSRDGPITDTPLTPIQTPTKLPKEYEWAILDINNSEQMDQLITFLNSYYTNNNTFSTIYTKESLIWYYAQTNHIMLCVKSSKHNMFVGFVCGKVAKTQINKTIDDFIEVRLLCIHQQLRTKRLVPCIITELTRQFQIKGYTKAIYNANIYINKPLISAKYYLKPLNVDKLIDTNFLKIDAKNNSVTIENIKKANELVTKKVAKNFKKMTLDHIEMAYYIFNKYMDKYNYHPIFTIEEFTHTFINNNHVQSFVFEESDEEGTYITDFVSYYLTDIEIIKGEHKGKTIKKASLYYYSCLNETSYSILKNALISANNNNIDVFCAGGVMEHCDVLKELGFEEFGQDTHYYLYNWKVRNMTNKQVGMLTF